MKKIQIIMILCLIFISGCSKSDRLECELGNDKISLRFENGQIVEYINGNGEKEEQSVLDEMNLYLNDITDNKLAKEKMKEVILSFGGDCS